MNQSEKKDILDKESTSTAVKPPAVLLEEALLACMPAPKVASLHEQANTYLVDDTTEANTGFATAGKDDSVSQTSLDRSTPPLHSAGLACMPGAYQVPCPGPATILHVMSEEEEGRPYVSAGTPVDVECEEQQQSAQTNIVSAYLVAEEEPAIVATPLKDNKYRILIYGLLVTAAVALIVGLSVGLTTTGKDQETSDSLGRLVSSLLFIVDKAGAFIKANRYARTENGSEMVTTTGSGVLAWCEVLPCIQGGCSLIPFDKTYEPGCCVGENCSPSDQCGHWCPVGVCRPSSDGCAGDAACFECDRGPNGEVLYRYRDYSFNVNCLRTGVATGFNDVDDDVERIYEWAIGCGYIVHGGSELLNLAPGEYFCAAARIGDGITKTISFAVPCQLIQLGECGCAPDDVQTYGHLPPPEKPCKTKQDCPYLCGDAGEEKAKTLCDAFPGIKWFEGENPIYYNFFVDPQGLYFGNATIQIDIHGE